MLWCICGEDDPRVAIVKEFEALSDDDAMYVEKQVTDDFVEKLISKLKNYFVRLMY